MDTMLSCYRLLAALTLLSYTLASRDLDICGESLTPAWKAEQGATCDCVMSGNDLVVDCSSTRRTHLPTEPYPPDTAIINLKNNQIKLLWTNGFPNIPHLQKVYLDNNDISDIEPNTFRGLSELVELHLSENELSKIHNWTFQDLVAVKRIFLKNNRLVSISKDPFFFMLDLTLIDLAANAMVCDCDAKKFRDWAKLQDISVVWPVCDNANGTDLGNVHDDIFPQCQDPPPQSCIGCHSSSVQDCLTDGHLAICGSYDSCQMTIDVISGQQVVKSHCQRSQECVAALSGNVRSCVNGESDQHCTFCCAGDNCTANMQLKGYTYGTTVRASFIMTEGYIPEFSNYTSPEYTELAYYVTTQLDSVLHQLNQLTSGPPFFQPVLYDGKIYTQTTISLRSVWPLARSPEDVRQAIYDLLNTAISNGDLGIGIIEDSLEVTVPEYCEPDVVFDAEKGVFQWPSTLAGTRAIVNCPYPGVDNAKATRRCLPSGARTRLSQPFWLAPDLSACAARSNVTEALKDLLDMPVTNESVSYIAEQLQNLTAGQLASVDMSYVSQLLEKVLTSGVYMAQDSARDVVRTYDNVIVTSQEVLTESQRNFGAIRRSLEALDHLSESLKVPPPDGTLTTQSVAVGVLHDIGDITGGAVFHIGRSNVGDFEQHKVSLTLNKSFVNPSKVDASISFPASVLAFMDYHGKAQFVAFSDDKLFQAMDNNQTNNADLVTNGHIMAATFGGVHIEHLPEPVGITFRHKEKLSGDRQCVFWDFHEEVWSTSGCRLVEAKRSVTSCECDHLTNFALIMDIYGTAGNLTEANRKALSIISYVGCGVSLGALVLTLATYTIFSKLRKDNPSKLLMNLCGALIMVMVLFVVVTQPAVRDKPMVCKAMAGLLHYFLIAAWVWMAIEAFNMYLTLIKIFNTYMSRFLLKCSLIGWGVPALVVVITVSISTDNYGLQGEICWLARAPFYGACMAPILLILTGNFVVFGLVIHQIRKLSQRTSDRSRKYYGVKTQLRGAFAVVVLLGLTWIFAIFAVGGVGIAFNYLFAIFNSFQGLFIFVFYCLLKKDVKDTWREKWTTITSSTGSSSATSSGKPSDQGSSSKYLATQSGSGLSTPEPSELRAATSKDIRALRGVESMTGSRERLNSSDYADLHLDVGTMAETSS